MRLRIMKLALPIFAVAATAAASSPPLRAAEAAPTETAQARAAGEPSLAAVRAATERFKDVNVALAEGYLRDPLNLCDTAEMMGRPAELGAMGIHFFRPDLLGITAPPDPRVDGTGVHTDFLKPSILIYEPQQDGSLQLVAVENLVFAGAWHAAGHDAPPSFQGWSTTLWPTIPRRRRTRRISSSLTTTATSGSIERTRTAYSRRSILPSLAITTRTAPRTRCMPRAADILGSSPVVTLSRRGGAKARHMRQACPSLEKAWRAAVV